VEKVKRTAQFALLAIAIHHAFLLHSVLACSRAYGPAIKVKTAFTVIVHDPAGNPLPGIEVRAAELIRKPPHVEVAAVANTGKDGKATISLTQDDYTIGATGNGISSEVMPIQVYDDGSGISEVSLTWPGGPITVVQSVSGIFGAGEEKSPWPGLEISLKSVSPGSIAKGVTDSSGHFAFQGISSGFYALHVSDPRPNTGGYLSKLEGDIPIEVRADAPSRELPLWGLVLSSCGLAAYKDKHSMIIFSP
jgi:hypothetical protein